MVRYISNHFVPRSRSTYDVWAWGFILMFGVAL